MNYYNNTKKFFVNLDNREDRLKITRDQVGNDFIRRPACCGADLTLDQLDSLFDMHECFKVYRCNQTFNQASATISQYSIYESVANDETIKDDEFVLICEDDNRYVKDFKEKFNQLLSFLYQDRFENAEIVILKYMIIKEQFDYCLINASLNHRSLEDKDKVKLKKSGFTDRQIDLFATYQFRRTVSINKEHIMGFDYKDVSPSSDPELYTNTQHICVAHRLIPFSASCYLIRKSTCKRIVNKYSRPWWFTDDFTKLVPLQNILLCSPFLANEPIEDFVSSINEPSTGLNHLNNKLSSFSKKYKHFMLKQITFINKWNYSPSLIKRKLITIIERVLFLV